MSAQWPAPTSSCTCGSFPVVLQSWQPGTLPEILIFPCFPRTPTQTPAPAIIPLGRALHSPFSWKDHGPNASALLSAFKSPFFHPWGMLHLPFCRQGRPVHDHLLSGRWIWQSNLNFLTAVFIYLSSKLFPLKHRGVGLNRHTSLQLGEVWYLHMLSLETLHFSITEVSELQAILGSKLCFNDSSGCCFVSRRRQAGSAVNWLAGNGK